MDQSYEREQIDKASAEERDRWFGDWYLHIDDIRDEYDKYRTNC